MKITVSLFGPLRERIGQDAVEVALEPSATVIDAGRALARAHPEAGNCLNATGEKLTVMVAVAGEAAPHDMPLSDGGQIEIIAPMAGG